MSRVRTFTPISEIDRMAEEEGLTLWKDGDRRRFAAFDRHYLIETAPPGKVGLFRVTVFEPEGRRTEGTFVRATVRRLFRRAAARTVRITEWNGRPTDVRAEIREGGGER